MKRAVSCAMLMVSLAIPAFATEAIAQSSPAGQKEWVFRVFLDDNEIGYHNFRLREEDGAQHLTTEAAFRVKFLFFTAFRYEHVNSETWRDNCLQEISSRTDANGAQFEVMGDSSADGLAVQSNDSRSEISGCVKTFAYWNPDILTEPRLLNSQTGEVLSVDVEMIARETLSVRGEDTPARRYRLVAKNMELDLWYSDDSQWLALESTVKGGRKLRYELT